MRDYKLINGDLLEADVDIICHQVNCQGKMRSGVAKAIREKYQQVYESYMQAWEEYKKQNKNLLGNIQCIHISNKNNISKPYYCINMFAQDNYGYDGKQYTSLEAFTRCLKQINVWAKDKEVAFPWKIACVRGGADWEVVLPMILEILTDVKGIYFYKL